MSLRTNSPFTYHAQCGLMLDWFWKYTSMKSWLDHLWHVRIAWLAITQSVMGTDMMFESWGSPDCKGLHAQRYMASAQPES